MKFQYLILLLIVSISCQSRDQKIDNYIRLLDNIKLDNPDSYVTSIKAVKSAQDQITISLNMDVDNNEINKQLYSSIFPELMEGMIFSLGASKNLIREGVKFNCLLIAKDNGTLAQKRYGVSELNSNRKPNMLDGEMTIQSVAELVNKGFPIKDTINDMTILGLEILNDKEVQFKYIVPTETMQLLKLDTLIIQYLKEDYLKNPQQKNAISSFFELGVERFYLSYFNEDKTLNEKIEFTAEDLK